MLKWMIPALFLAGGATAAAAQAGAPKCPVSIDRMELSYSHQGAPSTPQLRMHFINHSAKRVAAVTFTLLLLDSAGYSHPYGDDLSFTAGLEAAADQTFSWALAPDRIDIHRTGETVFVQKVEFDAGGAWVDDGSQACADTVDFHPR